MRKEAREDGRSAEVCANWCSGAAQNRREKHEKAGAIEKRKELGKSPLKSAGPLSTSNSWVRTFKIGDVSILYLLCGRMLKGIFECMSVSL